MLTATVKQSGLSIKARKRILRAPTISLLTHSPDNNRILFAPPICLISPVSGCVLLMIVLQMTIFHRILNTTSLFLQAEVLGVVSHTIRLHNAVATSLIPLRGSFSLSNLSICAHVSWLIYFLVGYSTKRRPHSRLL